MDYREPGYRLYLFIFQLEFMPPVNDSELLNINSKSLLLLKGKTSQCCWFRVLLCVNSFNPHKNPKDVSTSTNSVFYIGKIRHKD